MENPENNRKKSKIIKSLAKFLVRYSKILFFTTLLTVLAGSYFIKNILIDNSIELWFLENDLTLVAYNEFKTVYGNDEVIISMIDAGEGGIFTPAFLNKLRKASLDIEKNPDIRRVLSIGKAPYIGLRGAQDLIVEDLCENTIETQLQADETRKKFSENKLWPKLLADKDIKKAIMIVEPIASKEMDVKRPQMISYVRDKMKEHGFDYKLAGMGVMYDELNRLSLRDSAVFTTMSYMLLLVVVYLLYRSKHLVGIIFVIMVVSGLAFIDVYGLFHQNFNMVTIVLPTLIMILCIADVNHIFNRYCLSIPAIMKNKEEGLAEVFEDILAPSLFTSVTECIGFLSIVFTPIAVLRTFGLFAAYSAIAEYIIVWSMVPFMLSIIQPSQTIKLERPFETLNKKILAFVFPHKGLVVLGFVVLIAVSCYGVTILDVDTYSMGFLKPDNPVRKDSDTIESVYGNYLPLEVRLLTGKPDGIKEPEFLKRVVEAQDEIEKNPEASKCASVTDVIMRLNQVWTDGKPESYAVPKDATQVSQLLMLYESDPDGEKDLKYMVNKNYSEMRLTIRIPMVSASNMKKVEQKVSAILDKKFGNTKVKVIFGGYVPLYVRLLDYITWSQISSFASALVWIFVVIGILFLRFSALVWGIAPNVVPVIMTLGFMGIFGIRLDIATVTIASITLGIACDDTIHELFHYYAYLGKGMNSTDAIRECLKDEGPAVIATSIVLCIGFSILGLASIKSVVYFGLLISLTMLFAFLGELFMLPALISYFTELSLIKKLTGTKRSFVKKEQSIK